MYVKLWKMYEISTEELRMICYRENNKINKMFLALAALALFTGITATAFAELPFTDEQIQESIHQYVEDTYKQEGGKRSKDVIRVDYVQGSIAMAVNKHASEAFTEDKFDDCRFFANMSITDLEKAKASPKTMPMAYEQLELAYSITADCLIKEVMGKVVAAANVPIEKTVQNERDAIYKAMDYYTKVSLSTPNLTQAAIVNFNLGSLYSLLGDQNKGQPMFFKAFHNDQILNFIKKEDEQGHRVQFIWHDDSAYVVKNRLAMRRTGSYFC